MKLKEKKIILCYFLIFLFIICLSNKSNAAQEFSELNGKWFYIKNAYTGQYLDVYNGYAQNDTNVQQCKYNSSYAQKWYFHHLGNGEYMIFSHAGATTLPDGNTQVRYVLDVLNGFSNNGTNIQIYTAIDGNYAQKFSLTKTANSTYIIWTKASNYNSVVSLSNNVCSDGVNIHQWEYSNHSHDQWILEPIENTTSMGV